MHVVAQVFGVSLLLFEALALDGLFLLAPDIVVDLLEFAFLIPAALGGLDDEQPAAFLVLDELLTGLFAVFVPFAHFK